MIANNRHKITTPPDNIIIIICVRNRVCSSSSSIAGDDDGNILDIITALESIDFEDVVDVITVTNEGVINTVDAGDILIVEGLIIILVAIVEAIDD